jgi:hypothetical protein
MEHTWATAPKTWAASTARMEGLKNMAKTDERDGEEKGKRMKKRGEREEEERTKSDPF